VRCQLTLAEVVLSSEFFVFFIDPFLLEIGEKELFIWGSVDDVGLGLVVFLALGYRGVQGSYFSQELFFVEVGQLLSVGGPDLYHSVPQSKELVFIIQEDESLGRDKTLYFLLLLGQEV
jgi:hypothetical protein